MITKFILSALLVLVFSACATRAIHGPDKQFGEGLSGALSGAGSGIVTGVKMGASAGPAALVGAGLGAAFGGLSGAALDQSEEELLALSVQAENARREAWAQSVLSQHYERRLSLHPSRDLFPADLFFGADKVELKQEAKVLLREIAKLNLERLPWSRLSVLAYVKANDKNSEYARYLARKRAAAISDALVGFGIEARRLRPQGLIVKSPILLDPLDKPWRYNQAIEFVQVDR